MLAFSLALAYTGRVIPLRMKKKLPLIIGIAVLIAVAIGLSMLGNRPATTERTAREVALTCTTDMATEFHIHPVLDIYINGEKQLIPANVGITPNCMYSLHTHTPDGIIHVEAPEKKDFTLSDFFAVWDKPFSKDQIFEHAADATHRIRMTVNGEEVDTFENTLLVDQDLIVIYYEAIP
jgi:hypothetical protein